MGKLKISENLFLEVAELNRFQKFITEDGYKLALKSMVKKFGIVQNTDNTFFKVTKKSNDTILINAGIAFDPDFNAIRKEEDTELRVSNTGVKRWIILSYATTYIENGTVSVSVDGSLSGINTKFLEVLRGQPNFPTKVKFESDLNNREYEVVSVSSDNRAILSGSFVAESDMKYSVVGTFTPGFNPKEDDKEIYEYDSFNIKVVDSNGVPVISDNEFIIASIEFDDASVMTVNDERSNFIFNGKENTNTDNKSSENKLVSLLQASLIGGVDSVRAKAADIELILEHGYAVTSYDWNITPDYNIFKISAGSSNFLNNDSVPNGFFNGWILLNRVNMKFVMIERNEGRNLYISVMNPDITKGKEYDFVIIPKFSEIEYEVTLSSNVARPTCPFYFRNSVANIYSRFRFYATFPSFGGKDKVSVKIRYRFIDESGEKYPFYELSVARFTNVNGDRETLANSSFEINMKDIEPQEEKRNYS